MAILAIILCVLSLAGGVAVAQDKPAVDPLDIPVVLPRSVKPTKPAVAADPDAHTLVGQEVTLLITVRNQPKVMEGISITSIDAGEVPNTFVDVQFRLQDEPESKRARKLPASQIIRIIAGEGRYEVRFDRAEKVYRLIDVEQHMQAVEAKLDRQGEQLWQPRSDEEQAAAVAEYKEFLGEVNEKFGGKMRLIETDYFLFFSDLAEPEAKLSVQYLTAMYDKLCELFGVMPGENIWRGKCVIVAFHNEPDFHAFERVMMRNPDPAGKAGLHHGYSNGKSIISMMRGKNPAFYRVVLVHETVHGFLHRFKSSVNIPSWINEGIADWIADFIVPDSGEVKRRRLASRKQLLQTKRLGDEFYLARNISGGDYGTASDMTDMMVQADPRGYRQFLDGIKEGETWEDSLQQSFGVTPAELTSLYFRQRVVGR